MNGGRLESKHRRGFSLVELVSVIALTGVLAVGLGNLLQHPMNGYAQVSRRAELVSLADLAVRRLTRDLRLALPNSIRVSGGGEVIEFLHTSAGARYRLDPGVNDPGGPDEVDHRDAADWISFGDDARWNILGRFRNLDFGYGTPLAAGARVAIYPTGSEIWSEAASGVSPSSITPAATRITIVDDGDEDQIRLSTPHRFRLESPNLRMYLVDSPVSYVCDTTDASLWRVDGYTATVTQPTNRSVVPLSAGRVVRSADRLERCRFEYVPGTSSRAGLVSIEIVLAAADERVRLLQQVQVPNAP